MLPSEDLKLYTDVRLEVIFNGKVIEVQYV